MIKFCHNEDCRYVCESDPELDAWAHEDTPCPNCDDMTSLRTEVPQYLGKKLIRKWWRKHHKAKREK